MIVYVVSRWDWGGGGDDDRTLLGVFSERGHADACVSACTIPPPKEGYASTVPEVDEFTLDVMPDTP